MIPGQSFSSDFCKIPWRPWTFCYSFTITERRTEGGVHQEYCFITQPKVPLALKAPPPGRCLLGGWEAGRSQHFLSLPENVPFAKHVKENSVLSINGSFLSGQRPPPSDQGGSCPQLTLRWWQGFFTCCSPRLGHCCVLFLWISSVNPSYSCYGGDAVL